MRRSDSVNIHPCPCLWSEPVLASCRPSASSVRTGGTQAAQRCRALTEGSAGRADGGPVRRRLRTSCTTIATRSRWATQWLYEGTDFQGRPAQIPRRVDAIDEPVTTYTGCAPATGVVRPTAVFTQATASLEPPADSSPAIGPSSTRPWMVPLCAQGYDSGATGLAIRVDPPVSASPARVVPGEVHTVTSRVLVNVSCVRPIHLHVRVPGAGSVSVPGRRLSRLWGPSAVPPVAGAGVRRCFEDGGRVAWGWVSTAGVQGTGAAVALDLIAHFPATAAPFGWARVCGHGG